MTSGSPPPDEAVDVLIIGGGINGAGIACDAAGRGLSVVLCEQGDLGGATSSASSKLIHGGLRYLEHYAFRLVRESLTEREVLLAKAPHIVHPLPFVLVHDAMLRPVWMIRLGLWLYDHLGVHRTLPASRTVDLATALEGAPLKDANRRGFVYADAKVDDARLVILNALAASDHGAEILTGTECLSAMRDGDVWRVRIIDHRDGREREITARALINAAGPWAESVQGRTGSTGNHRMRLVKGSHIVVPRLYAGEFAYLLQQPDKRVVFVIPFEDDFSLIGTTEVPFSGDPADVTIDDEETRYLCQSVNRYFRDAITPDDVVWSYAGIRPLWDDQASNASAVTRDYVLELDETEGGAPLLSVFGGKITTYRQLAEVALHRLQPWFPAMGPPWTKSNSLPGGDLPTGGMPALIDEIHRHYPWLPDKLARGYAERYGTRVRELLGDATDPGADLGAGLYECELEFLIRTEWAETAEDVLWRRTKLGLRMSPDRQNALAARFTAK